MSVRTSRSWATLVARVKMNEGLLSFGLVALALTIKFVIVSVVVTGCRLNGEDVHIFGATFALVVLLLSTTLLFPVRSWFFAVFGIDLVLSLLGLADLVHQRLLGDVTSAAEMLHAHQLLDIRLALVEAVRWQDLLILADVPLLFLVALERPVFSLRRRRIFLAASLVGIMMGAPSLISVIRDRQGAFEYVTTRHEVIDRIGLLGYHTLDVLHFMRDGIFGPGTVAAGDRLRAVETLAGRAVADSPRSPLFGAAQGHNLILILAESLQAFPLGLEVDGIEITPNLNAFIESSLDYRRFFDQTHTSTTADAELMILQSLYPLRMGAVQTRLPTNDFHGLPKVLQDHGYATMSICGQRSDFWNMRAIHSRFGFGTLMYEDQFDGRRIGLGIADRDVFRTVPLLFKKLPEPFFCYLISLTNHYPYPQLTEEHSSLRFGSLEGTLTGNYLQTVHYFDSAFGDLMAGLRRSGLLHRSLVVVVGDHLAFLERPSELIRLLEMGDGAPVEQWLEERRLPLLIRLPKGAHAGPRFNTGGHLDVAPTLLTLLGIPLSAMPAALGHDLTCGKDSVVIRRDGEIFVGPLAARPHEGSIPVVTDTRTGKKLPNQGLGARLEIHARAELDLSDAILHANLVPEIAKAVAAESPPIEPRAVNTKRRPPTMVVGHRGSSTTRPENTLAALDNAFALGAEVVEVDLRKSAEGVLYLYHDEVFERTSNGSGPVRGRSWSELENLDVGSWFSPKFAGEHIPTLKEAVLSAARYRGRLLLDIKEETPMAADIAAVLGELGLPDSLLIIGAWLETHLEEYPRYLPGSLILWNASPPRHFDREFFSTARARGIDGFELSTTTPVTFISAALDQGMPVFVYTVNDENELRRMLDLGITGVETDRVERFLNLRDRKTRWPDESSDIEAPER